MVTAFGTGCTAAADMGCTVADTGCIAALVVGTAVEA